MINNRMNNMRKMINVILRESQNLLPNKFWFHPVDDRIIEVEEHATDLLDLWGEMGLPEKDMIENIEHITSFDDEEDQKDALDAIEGDLIELAFKHGWIRGGFGGDLMLHGEDTKSLRHAVEYFTDMYPTYATRIILEINHKWQGWLEGNEITRFIKRGTLPVPCAI